MQSVTFMPTRTGPCSIKDIILAHRGTLFDDATKGLKRWILFGRDLIDVEQRDKASGYDHKTRFVKKGQDCGPRGDGERFPYSIQTADMFKRISKVYGPYGRARKSDEEALFKKLPGDYSQLYELSFIPKAKLNELLAQDDSPIHPCMGQAKARELKKLHAPVERVQAKKKKPAKPKAKPKADAGIDEYWGEMRHAFEKLPNKKTRAVEFFNLMCDLGLSISDLQEVEGK